jgi:hypothetical protein
MRASGVKKAKYPHAWPGPSTSSVMPQDEIDKLRCGFEGCDRGWNAPGGLCRYGGNGEWRCVDHRKAYDPSPHRSDLRDAHQRGVDAAVTAERERIIAMLEQSPVYTVLMALTAQRPKKPESPVFTAPPVPEGT